MLNPEFAPYQCELVANELLHFFGEDRETELARHAVDLSNFGTIAWMYPPDDPHNFPKHKDLLYYGIIYPNPRTAGFGLSGCIKHLLYSSVWWGVRLVLRDFDVEPSAFNDPLDPLMLSSDMGYLEKPDRDGVYRVVRDVGGIDDIRSPPNDLPTLDSKTVSSDTMPEELHNWCYCYGVTPGIIRRDPEILRDKAPDCVCDALEHCHSPRHATLEIMSFLFDIMADAFRGVEFREPLKSMLNCEQVVIEKSDGGMFPMKGHWRTDGHIGGDLVEKIRLLVEMLLSSK